MDNATFEVQCSKGTYVRTLAHDIAHALNTVGVVTMLRRTVCLPFDLSQTVVVDEIKSGKITVENLPLIPMELVVKDMPKISFSINEIKRLSHGQRLSLPKLEISQKPTSDGIYCAENESKICGLVCLNGVVISPEFMWT